MRNPVAALIIMAVRRSYDPLVVAVVIAGRPARFDRSGVPHAPGIVVAIGIGALLRLAARAGNPASIGIVVAIGRTTHPLVVAIIISIGRSWNPAALGRVVAVAADLAGVGNPAVAIIATIGGTFDPLAFAVIIAGGIPRADAGGVPPAAVVIITIGMVAIACGLGDLIANHRPANGTDHRAERLVTLAGYDVAEDAADTGTGNGCNNPRRTLTFAAGLGLCLRLSAGDRRDQGDGGNACRKQLLAHKECSRNRRMPDCQKRNSCSCKMFHQSQKK